jgi:hypothetical protein
MISRWVVWLTVPALVLMAIDTASAQRGRGGRRGGGASQTAFGPVPSGMTIGQYQNMLLQQQQLRLRQQMLQQQMKMQQEWAKQQEKTRKDQIKKGDKADEKKKADTEEPSQAAPRPLSLQERREIERKKLAEARARLGLDPPQSGQSSAKPAPKR